MICFPQFQNKVINTKKKLNQKKTDIKNSRATEKFEHQHINCPCQNNFILTTT